MMHYYFCMFTFLLLVTSCSKKTPRAVDKNIYRLEVNEESKISFYDLFSKIEVIPLETNDSSLLMDVSQGVKMHNNFYILDYRQKIIQVFGSDGSYLTTLDKRGNGPGEYTELYDFSFNRFTGNLEILSPMGGIYVYDSTGTDYKEHISLPPVASAAQYFVAEAPCRYLFFSAYKEGGKLIHYDSCAEQVLSETYNLGNQVSRHMYGYSHSPFYKFEAETYFVQAYDGAVYLFADSLRQFRAWNFGDRTLLPEKLPQGGNFGDYRNWRKTIGSQYLSSACCYQENQDYFFITFHQGQKNIFHLVLDKNTDKPILFSEFEEGMKFSAPDFITDDALYSLVTIDLLPLVVTDAVLDEATQKLIASLEEDSNPVLLKYSLK